MEGKGRRERGGRGRWVEEGGGALSRRRLIVRRGRGLRGVNAQNGIYNHESRAILS